MLVNPVFLIYMMHIICSDTWSLQDKVPFFPIVPNLKVSTYVDANCILYALSFVFHQLHNF
jgi:hypothetical protein